MDDKAIRDPDATAEDETATGGETPAATPAAADSDVTRLASEAELADLSRIRMAAPRRRKSLMLVVIVLLIAFIAAVVGMAFSQYEAEISWPGEKDDSFDDARQLLRIENDVALLVYWPNGPQNVVTGDGTNVIDVIAGVGCQRDVPFHLRVTQTVLTNGLVTTTADSFDEWKRARLADGWSFDVSSEELVFINDHSSGYPAWKIDYGRRSGSSLLGGRALYIRHLDHEIVLLRELPVFYRGRAERLLDGYPCIAANLDAVRRRFEIPAQREPGDPAALMASAFTAVQHNFLSSDWRRLDRTLRTIILSSMETGQTRRLENAQYLYVVFRMNMQNWYVRQCLAFMDKVADDPDGLKLASARTAIRRECARRLPNESDARQKRIAHDEWSVK